MALGGETRLREQLIGAEPLVPGSHTDGDAQRLALPFDLDLDRVQSPERATRDDLAASLVRPGQEHQQLAVPQRTDAVEAAQLAPSAAPRYSRACAGSSCPCVLANCSTSSRLTSRQLSAVRWRPARLTSSSRRATSSAAERQSRGLQGGRVELSESLAAMPSVHEVARWPSGPIRSDLQIMTDPACEVRDGLFGGTISRDPSVLAGTPVRCLTSCESRTCC